MSAPDRRIPQSVKDALADAETRSLHEAWARDQLFRHGDAAWSDPAVKAIFEAWLLRNEPSIGWDTYDAARAAFRAVPGLRGE